MAQKGTKKNQKKKKQKLMKAIFGKNLSLVMVLLLLIGAAFGLLYEQNEFVRDFVDGLGIFSTTAPTTQFIDPNGDELAVHFIDVGQGDCTLLQTAVGSVLIDCAESEYGESIVTYLKSQGVDELEYFIITHPDSDHMGAAAYIINNITVKTVVMNGMEKSAKFFEKALDAMEDKGVEGIIAQPLDVFTVGALQLKILGPYVEDIDDLNSNDSSLIIHAIFGHRSFLFTGDSEEEGEEILLDHHTTDLKCDVFSAGHHGSKTSNSKDLLKHADPDYVVVSCGEDNSYGHPHAQAVEVFNSVGATVLRTDKLGTIVFVTNGETLEMK